MKTKATFTVELEFDTEKKLSLEDHLCTMNKIANTLMNECNSGNGLAAEVNNDGYTTKIVVTSVTKPNIAINIKL